MKKKIKIGDRIYKIQRQSKLNIGGEKCSGGFNYTDKIIKIRKIGKVIDMDSLYHEISHGIMIELSNRCFNKEKKKIINNLNKNEDFIDCMGLMLRKTFKLR